MIDGWLEKKRWRKEITRERAPSKGQTRDFRTTESDRRAWSYRINFRPYAIEWWYFNNRVDPTWSDCDVRMLRCLISSSIKKHIVPNTFCIINDEVASSVVLQTQFYRVDWLYVVSQMSNSFRPISVGTWAYQMRLTSTKVMGHETALRLTGEWRHSSVRQGAFYLLRYA